MSQRAGGSAPSVRLAWPLLVALIAVAGVVAAFWVAGGTAEPTGTMYAGEGDWFLATTLIAVVVTLSVGFAASLVAGHQVTGIVLAGLGLCWLAPEVSGWTESPAWARSASVALGAMFLPLLVHLGLGYPNGPRGTDRMIVLLAYVGGATMAVLVLVGYDPFLDLDCWRTCSPSAVAVFGSRGMTQVLVAIVPVVELLLAGGLLARLLPRGFRDGSRLAPVPLAVVGLAIAVIGVSTLMVWGVDPPGPAHLALHAASGWLLVAVGVGLAWDLAALARRRRFLAALALDLGDGTSRSLASTLRESLRDDTVEVRYWIPRLQRYVDAEGRSVDPEPAPGRTVATIERSGEELGMVLHRSALSVSELEHEIGAAAKLAVDNERLRAELRWQAFEMRAAQERIVLAADTARRRIERDLHDGAQQRLLTLSYQLRLARAEAEAAGDEAAVSHLDLATEDLVTAIGEVRNVAHGIFPSILANAGLARALESVREDTGLPQHIEVPAARFSPAAEMAAYQLVTAAIEGLPTGPNEVRVIATETEGRLDIEIRANVRPESLIHVVDRIGALGGTVGFTSDGILAEVPCG
jgi:signal transduction histidine kinase